MSEEQKIIDLENEIIFLKDVLSEKQKEIEEKSTIIMAGAEKVKQLEKEIEELKNKNNILENLLKGNLYEMYLYYKELANKYQGNCISKDKIREKIKEIESYAFTSEEEKNQQDYAIQRIKELLEE